MNCLLCDAPMVSELSWSNLFSFSESSRLCRACIDMLYRLQGKRCTRCSRECDRDVCLDCQKWGTYYVQDDPLTYNYSLYAYNAKMQEILSRWKYRGDYQLGEIFQKAYSESFKRHFPSRAVIVPIPLSQERLNERAFNQASMLASFLSGTAEPLLTRIHSRKQSKKTRKERLGTVNPFHMTQSIEKPVILIDDLYTTGTTLRHAATLLKYNGCPRVAAYTLIRA